MEVFAAARYRADVYARENADGLAALLDERPDSSTVVLEVFMMAQSERIDLNELPKSYVAAEPTMSDLGNSSVDLHQGGGCGLM